MELACCHRALGGLRGPDLSSGFAESRVTVEAGRDLEVIWTNPRAQAGPLEASYPERCLGAVLVPKEGDSTTSQLVPAPSQ